MIRKIVIVGLTLGAATATLLFAATFGDQTRWIRTTQGGWYLLGADRPLMPVSPRVELRWPRNDWETTTRPSTLAYAYSKLRLLAQREAAAYRWQILGLAAALATYPTIAFIRGPLRRWRRRKRGECVRCGYNLTGNVSGVCPECGTEIKP